MSKSNRSGIGARVVCTTPDSRRQIDEVRERRFLLSQNDLRVHFGLGAATAATIEVQWPSGVMDKMEALQGQPDHHRCRRQGADAPDSDGRQPLNARSPAVAVRTTLSRLLPCDPANYCIEPMKTSTLLRTYIEAPELLMIPGVPDALGARLAEQAGFKAVFLSGYAASASLLGAPDVGLLTMTEMAECARRIADAVRIPLFADGDNGHGNVNNVMRTMREFERAGIAAIFFEDQVSPKRCGHMYGKQVIPAGEMVARIRAAVDTRIDGDLLIMARTDSLGINGIDDAIERMHRYLEAGADLSFVEAPTSVEQMQRITREISAPNMANVVAGGKTPILTAQELQDLGFAFQRIRPCSPMRWRDRCSVRWRICRMPVQLQVWPKTMEFEEFNAIVGLGELRRRESEFYAE